MVDIRTLWNNGMFQSLTNNSKLVYIYLATSPSLNTAGVVCLNPEAVSLLINISLDEFRKATQELVDKKYVFVKSYEELIYFIIPKHFSTVNSSDAMIEKIKSDMKSLPESIYNFLVSVGISADKKRKRFDKPSIQEIEEYSMTQGYLINGDVFYNFYENNPRSDEHLWYDGRGKLVLDWKSKLRKVWFKEDRKVKLVKGAPKGFETFYIKDGENFILPDGWRDGKPYTKDFLSNKKLQEGFDRFLK